MAVVEVPGSKSITARALFLAAAARGTTVLRKPLDSARAGAGTVAGRGAPRGARPRAGPRVLRDGATTSRFLPALAAAGHGEFHFDASAQMRRRPLGPLTNALRSLGITLDNPGCVKKTFPGFHNALAELQSAWEHGR